ncbi:MAG: TonB-dependent receptor [Pseudomonadota bacterium]
MKCQKTAVELISGVSMVAIMAAVAQPALAQSIDDEIIVTSQRTEQSLQDVPIAVSAFGGEELDNRQIESFTDIQFNIPNFSFSRSNFTGSSISLRGVGALAVGSSTEPSVSVHINDVFINAPRLFETEFFDIERLEILRGPQGTLFGRNATGGVINVITAKADPSEVGGHVDVEYGNFNSVKVKGALNVPIIQDVLAARLAGTVIQRDGFTENIVTGNDIDDRDIYALRFSSRWLPTDNTTVDFTASYFKEEDARQRASNTTCNTDPSGLLGCLPGPVEFGGLGPDQRATFLANTSQEALGLIGALNGLPGDAAGVFGLFSLTEPQLFQQALPTDPRQVAFDFDPQNNVEETIFLVNVKHDFEKFSFKFNAGWGNSKIAQLQDFDGGVGPALATPAFLSTGLPQGALFPGAPAGALGPGSPAIPPAPSIDVGGVPILANNFFNNGLIPLSAFNFDQLTGSITGDVFGFFDNYQSANLSIGENDYYSFEAIFASEFDGRFNFLLGANYSDSNGFADFAVSTTGLDYFSAIGGTLAARGGTYQAAIQAGLGADPFVQGGVGAGLFSIADLSALAGADPQAFVSTVGGAITGVAAQQMLMVDGTAIAQGILDNAVTAANQVDGLAFFTPYFFNDTDDGFTEDFSIFGEVYVDITDTLKLTGGVRRNFTTKGVRDRGNLLESLSGTPPVVPIGTPTVRPLLDSDELNQGTPGAINDFRVIDGEFNATTGRAVLQWTPTDGIEAYASYTRGFKAGGFNPLASVGLPGVPTQFDPESINAYEAGVKTVLAGGALRANLTGFYYDYSDLQVSNIVNNTSVNENIDATIFGLEGEFVWRPVDDLIFNTTLSYLNTDITDFQSLDTRDPLGGSTEDVLLADITNGQNCILDLNGSPNFIGAGNPVRDAIIDGLNNAGQAGLAGQFAALTGSPFTACGPLQSLVDGLQAFNLTGASVTAGNTVDISGNDLPGSPEFTVSVGAQYSFRFDNGMSLTPRADVYYQGASFSSTFNTQEDRIDSYVLANAQIMLEPEDGAWFVRAFIQNLTDNDAITGQFNAGQAVGNFNNVFLVEPRRYGIGLGLRF